MPVGCTIFSVGCTIWTSEVPNHSHKYVPTVCRPNYPKPLQSLFDAKYLAMDKANLLECCEAVNVHVTVEMADNVERDTWKQSKSNLWYKYWAGRTTASRMKAVCHTDLTNPAQSLIKSIAYPEAFKFSTAATTWGCTHEKAAWNTYTSLTSKSHNFLPLMMLDYHKKTRLPHNNYIINLYRSNQSSFTKRQDLLLGDAVRWGDSATESITCVLLPGPNTDIHVQCV